MTEDKRTANIKAHLEEQMKIIEDIVNTLGDIWRILEEKKCINIEKHINIDGRER